MYALVSGLIALILGPVGCNGTKAPSLIQQPDDRRREILPSSFVGIWEVTSWTLEGVSALGLEEAKAFRGRRVEFREDFAILDGHRCDSPGYEHEDDAFWRRLEECRRKPSRECKFLVQEEQSIRKCLGANERVRVSLTLELRCSETRGMPFWYRLVSEERILGHLDGVSLCFVRTK